MKRRDFLRTAGGATGAAAAASAASSPAAAASGVGAIQDEDGNTTQPDDGGGNQSAGGGNQSEGGGNESEGGGLPGAGETQTVVVGPGGENVFDPSSVEVLPGTEVVFEWDSDNHNVVVDSQPGDADWSGHETIENTGFSFSHTFTVEGEYAYYCEPHVNAGMEATITVTEDAGSGGGGGGGYEPPDPAHMGIPVQKHFIGAIAFMGIFVTLVFTFYLLKYGESAHTAAPSKRD